MSPPLVPHPGLQFAGVDAAAWFTAAFVFSAGWCGRPRCRSRRVTTDAERPSRAPRSLGSRPTSDRRRHRVRLFRRRRDQGTIAQWCDDLARAVRGGSSITAALRTVTWPATEPIEAKMHGLLHDLDRGRSLNDSLGDHAPTSDGTAASADLQLVWKVFEQSAAAGGSSAEPLERTAAVLRARDAARGEVAAQSASARLSAVVLTLLPVAMLLLLLATSASTRHAVGSPIGIVVIVAGSALNFAGWRWIQRLVGAVA